ncbi:lipid A-modifier LpxR family protein [Paracoccus litorisediminis]|uniref:lipid A-modifier LpxR family protein n=1 Tax=Paracoccus litorisediminis TaxID=2006130 RepID=UPI003733DA6B
MSLTRNLLVAATLLAPALSPAIAGEISTSTQLLTDDYLGDGHDRWRSASYATSRLNGNSDSDVREFRLRFEMITPNRLKLATSEDADRPAAGLIGFGFYRSGVHAGLDYRLGAGLAATGPSVMVLDFQDTLHQALGMDELSKPLLDGQIGDKVRPTLSGEIGHQLGRGQVEIRPWLAAETGFETMARGGVDLVVGAEAFGFGVRDEVTGWRLPVNEKDRETRGLSFIAGADIAHVFDSVLLDGREIERDRTRLRAGLQYHFNDSSVFMGWTRLSEEFKGQLEPQTTASISVNIGF